MISDLLNVNIITFISTTWYFYYSIASYMTCQLHFLNLSYEFCFIEQCSRTLSLPINKQICYKVIRSNMEQRNKMVRLPEKMFTTTEVARVFRVHPNTVRHWANQGILRPVRLGPRRDRRFTQEELARFIKEGENGGNGAKARAALVKRSTMNSR